MTHAIFVRAFLREKWVTPMNSPKLISLVLAACAAILAVALHSSAGDSPKPGDVTEARVAADVIHAYVIDGKANSNPHTLSAKTTRIVSRASRKA